MMISMPINPIYEATLIRPQSLFNLIKLISSNIYNARLRGSCPSKKFQKEIAIIHEVEPCFDINY